MSETESLMLRILEGIQRDMADVKRDMAALREEMQVGFAAVMRQNDRRFLDHEGRLRALEKPKRR